MDLYQFSSFWIDFAGGMLKPVASTAAVAMAVALSFSQNLDLQAEMIYATARSFLQLSLVGFFLHFIFSQKAAAWILLPYLFCVFLPREKTYIHSIGTESVSSRVKTRKKLWQSLKIWKLRSLFINLYLFLLILCHQCKILKEYRHKQVPNSRAQHRRGTHRSS